MGRVFAFAGAFLFAAGLGAGWTAQFWRYEARIADLQAAWAKEHAAQLTVVRQVERDNYDNILEAYHAATERHRLQMATARAAAAEADGLREQLADFDRRVSDFSDAAVRERAVTLNGLLGDCAVRYQGMAGTAQRHADDVKLLLDAWPGGHFLLE